MMFRSYKGAERFPLRDAGDHFRFAPLPRRRLCWPASHLAAFGEQMWGLCTASARPVCLADRLEEHPRKLVEVPPLGHDVACRNPGLARWQVIQVCYRVKMRGLKARLASFSWAWAPGEPPRLGRRRMARPSTRASRRPAASVDGCSH